MQAALKTDKVNTGVSLKIPRVERQMALLKASKAGCREGAESCPRSSQRRGTRMRDGLKEAVKWYWENI